MRKAISFRQVCRAGFTRAGLCVIAVLGPIMPLDASAAAFQQCGRASWYKLTGTTASGERADPGGMTAAHRTLPFGTLVDVTNMSNGRTVTVRINDRGPYSKGRVIDVTRKAARELGFIRKGITKVRVSSNAAQTVSADAQNCQ